MIIADTYGRRFRKLRVSLLDHCNLGCVYCVAGDVPVQTKTTRQDPANLLTTITRLHKRLDLQTVRLTGGEPLLYPELSNLIQGIKGTGIPHIGLTTNGYLLERMAQRLQTAGLDSINVSLDAIDESIFSRISRRSHVDRIIQGIDTAIDAGLSVKINTVVMKGINDSQILPLLEFAHGRGIRVRFLELMAMGHLHSTAGALLLPQDEILALITTQHAIQPIERTPSATARYWKTADGAIFGIIANESVPFCRDCDRLRLDSNGNIYGCLSSNHPIPLGSSETTEEWDIKLREALLQKQPLRFTGSDLSMLHIGG